MPEIKKILFNLLFLDSLLYSGSKSIMPKESLTVSGPDQIFEQAKNYFGDDSFDESLKLLSTLVDLQPQNAEYLAWQARVFLAKEDPKAFETAENAIKLDEFQPLAYAVRGILFFERGDSENSLSDLNKAIELNENLSIAYAWRGEIYLSQQKFTEAIRDFTKAIDINPKYAWALRMRAKSYIEIGNYKKAIVDRALSCEISTPRFYPEDSPLFLAERHFIEILMPILQDNDEHFVEFWAGTLYWDLEERVSIIGGSSSTDLHGTCGTGYLCLTDKNIRIVSLSKLAQQMPPIDKAEMGLGGLFLKSLLPTYYRDCRKVEKKDRVWTVPNSSIIKAKLTKPTGFNDDEKFVKLVTDVETWEIFSNDPETLLTGINMAATGELAKIWDDEELRVRSEEEIFALIERLAELKQKGAISDEDFEGKKKELLSRL